MQFAVLVVQAVLAVVSPEPSPSPSPCPAASAVMGAASPAPCPNPALKEIGRTAAQGRRENLVGKADAASEGYISQLQIETRPLLRPGEVLEAIPGLVISQHSGEGKANQYYLRGFQLDHGTDLASTIIGEPINLPTHAHGQGYSDINWLIPELVSFVQYKKGPYYADEGDFSTAGSYDLFYRNTIAPTSLVMGGDYGAARVLLADSPAVGAGHLLYALEYYHDNGTFTLPDNDRKYNGVLRYSTTGATSDFNVTALAYSGIWNSTDQIPQREVNDGILGRFDAIDPTDGGMTHRLSLSAQYQKLLRGGLWRASAWGYESYLNLYSNFTYSLNDATDYYNVTANPITCSTRYSTCASGPGHINSYTSYCPANDAPPGPGGVPQPFSFSCGDQREQEDARFVSGFDVERLWQSRTTDSLLGLRFRNDNISTVGLFLTDARQRFVNGTVTDDHVVESDLTVYGQVTQRIGSKLRIVGGLRGDAYDFTVHAYDPLNSGATQASLLLPKLTAAYTLSTHNEVYLNLGESFHSNDARGLTATVDPYTHASVDASGTPVAPVTPLVRANGEEFGYRYGSSKLNTTVSLWRLGIASELVFEGDDGTTSAARPTIRQGVEVANFYSPIDGLTLALDYANSSARFTTDPDHIGTHVPESIDTVATLGVTIARPRYQAAVQLRYFGPRDLIEDGSAVSAPSLLLSTQLSYSPSKQYKITLDVFNLANAPSDDIEYYYGSWTKQDAANPALAGNPNINPALGGSGVNDYHIHPSESRAFRLNVARVL